MWGILIFVAIVLLPIGLLDVVIKEIIKLSIEYTDLLIIICLASLILVPVYKSKKKHSPSKRFYYLSVISGFILITGLFHKFIPDGMPLTTISSNILYSVQPYLEKSNLGSIMFFILHIVPLVLYFVDLFLPAVIMFKINKVIDKKVSKYNEEQKNKNIENKINRVQLAFEKILKDSKVEHELKHNKPPFGISIKNDVTELGSCFTSYKNKEIIIANTDDKYITNSDRYVELIKILKKCDSDFELVDGQEQKEFLRLNELKNEGKELMSVVRELINLNFPPHANSSLVSDLKSFEEEYKKFMDNSYRKMVELSSDARHRLINDYVAISRGIKGEEEINKVLNLYERSIFNLPNIRLSVDGENIEVDNILITSKGIFLIEVKNIGVNNTFSLKIERDGRWRKIYKDQVRDFEGSNPAEQNNRHIAYLSKYINDSLGRSIDNEIEVKGIIVIANDVIDISNESMQYVVRSSEVMTIINQYPKVLAENEMVEIREILRQANIGEGKFQMEDYEKTVYESLKSVLDIAQDITDNIKPLRHKLEGYKDSLKNLIDEEDYNASYFLKNA